MLFSGENKWPPRRNSEAKRVTVFQNKQNQATQGHNTDHSRSQPITTDHNLIRNRSKSIGNLFIIYGQTYLDLHRDRGHTQHGETGKNKKKQKNEKNEETKRASHR